MSDFALRLRSQDTSFEKHWPVETTNLAIDHKLSDATTLTATVSTLVFSNLTFPFIASVEWTDGMLWGDMPGGSFLFNEIDDDAVDPSQARSLTGVQIVPWLLQNLVVMPTTTTTSTDKTTNGQRLIIGSPGHIVGMLIAEGHTRGWGPNLVNSESSGAVDANGVAWQSTDVHLTMNVGDTVWSVLTNLVSQGVIEFNVVGQTINFLNPGTGKNLTAGNPHVSLVGDSSTTPVQQSWTNIATKVYGQMDKQTGTTFSTVPSAYTALGTLETWVSLSGITTQADADLILTPAATAAATPQRSVSITENGAGATYLPWRDFNIGDTVAFIADQGWESDRVTEITVNYDGTGVTIQTTFGKAFLTATEKAAGVVAQILGGQKLGGTGAFVAPRATAPVPTTAPTPVASPVSVWAPVAGTATAAIPVTWGDVTTDTNGQSVDVATYEVWTQDASDPNAVYTLTATSSTPSVTLTSLPVGGTFNVGIVTVTDLGGRSDMSAPITVTVPSPPGPPQPPSTPTLTSALGIVSAAWDGKMADGTFAPAQIASVHAELSTSQTGTFATVGQPLGHAGTAQITGQSIGGTVWVQFVAVDNLGQSSAPSTAVSVTVVGVTGPDLEANSVTANNIEAGALDGFVITGAVIQSNADATTGVKMTDSGLVGYDANNAAAFSLEDGELSLYGVTLGTFPGYNASNPGEPNGTGLEINSTTGGFYDIGANNGLANMNTTVQHVFGGEVLFTSDVYGADGSHVLPTGSVPIGAWSASATTNATTGTDLHQALNTVVFPAQGGFGALSSGLVTIPRNGWYLYSMEILWAASAAALSSQYFAGVSTSGNSFAVGQFAAQLGPSTGSWRQSASFLVYHTAGTTVGPIARQSTGSTITSQCSSFRIAYQGGV